MAERGRISPTQATLLMVSTVLPTAILFVPPVVVRRARQDAWMSLALAVIVGLLVARLVIGLSLRFPRKTLFQYSEEILGRAGGKAVGLLYIWWFLHTGALVITDFAALPCIALMPETPFIVFFILGIAVSGYAVRGGLEVLSRYNELVTPVSLGSIALIFALLTKEMRIERLLPVFDTGAISILKGSATPAGWLGEIVLLSMVAPYLSNEAEVARVAYVSVLAVGACVTAATVGTLLVFGPDLTGAWVFPVFSAVRSVVIANFLERLESVAVSVWVFLGLAKIGVFYYAAVLGSAQWLGLKDYRCLVAPTGVILLGMALLCPSTAELFEFAQGAFPVYALTVFEVGIPLLLSCVARIRGKGATGGA
ncbi:MAG: spore germination protein [Firmicutes bacterium]|nr:spore germination protein [Bacillota bacterium]